MSRAKAPKSSNADWIGRVTSERTVNLDDPKFLRVRPESSRFPA